MTRRAALDADLGEVFSVRDALLADVSAQRLRASDLDAPFHGGRMLKQTPPPAATVFEQEHSELTRLARAFLAVAPQQFAFSHVTAARLYRIPLPRHCETDPRLHVTVPPAAQPPRRPGVVGHRGALTDVRYLDGVPALAPARVWAQLATVLSVDELVVAGDFLVRRKRPLCEMGELLDALVPRMRGIAVGRAAARGIRPLTDSPAESRTRLVLVREGLPEPIIRYTVHDADGYFVGTPDLAYIAERVAIEYEGDEHRTNRDVFEDDIIRRELFERAGWKVILVTDRRLRNPGAVVAEVRVALTERAVLR